MSKLLKDQINETNIKKLAHLIFSHDKSFDINLFLIRILTEDWKKYSLKQRIRKVSSVLHELLGGSYTKQLSVLLKVHHDFSGLFHLVFADFVEVYGLDSFTESMLALQAFTESSSAEFAIRPFLQKHPEETKQYLLQWAKSSNEHHRRLASEGVRPKLPWAQQIEWIAKNPDWVLPIIELLIEDESAYVRKSVANLLNDLSKNQKDWVLGLIASWNLQNPASFWIAKHALRTLLKQANEQALLLIGYARPTHIQLVDSHIPDQVAIGNKLPIQFSIESPQTLGLIRLEYAIYFLRKNQTWYRKVFKISELKCTDKSRQVKTFHDFKLISTRTYVPGCQRLELIVNGQVFLQTEFVLLC